MEPEGWRGARERRPPTAGMDQIGDTLADSAVYVLIASCGSCHGPDAPLEGSGGIRFIDDPAQLVAAGLLVPLSSASSPVIRVMVDGSMPPPEAGLPEVTDADIGTVASYVDSPRYWPDLPAPAEPVPPPDTERADAGASRG